MTTVAKWVVTWWAKPKTMVMVNRDYDDDDGGDLGDDACCVSVTLSGFLQNRTRAPLSDDSQAQAPMGMSKKKGPNARE